MPEMISFFKKISQTKNPENIHFTSFLDKIKDGAWQDSVLKVRAESDENKRKQLKAQVPYVTVSGTFSERNNNGLIEHSHLLAIDFDDVDVQVIRPIIEADPYTYAGFVSIGGFGYCAVVQIDPKKHLDAFEGLESYFFNKYGLIADTACKDLSRPRYVSYDPHAFSNPNSKKFTEYIPKAKVKTKIPDAIVSKNDITGLLQKVIDARVDITGNYHQWLQIAFAIESEFGADGLDYFKAISQFSDQYSEKACEKQYSNCLKSRGRGISIATLIYFARMAGIEPVSDETRTIITYAKQAKKRKDSVFQTVKMLSEFEQIDAEISTDVVEQVFQKNVDTRLENELPLLDQLRIFISSNYPSIRRNEITRLLEINGRGFTKEEYNSIYLKALATVGDSLRYELFERLLHSDFIPNFNPFMEFFNNNLHRRSSGLIQQVYDCIKLKGDSENYAADLFSKWLVSIIASIHGDHSPLCLVLVGGQYIGKTRFFRGLLPNDWGEEYFTQCYFDKGKDDEILMCEKLILFDDEFGGKTRNDQKLFKRLTETDKFSLREPYGKHHVTRRRLAVLCGSSNEMDLLNDPTGNRRIIPFEVNDVDLPTFQKINKTDLFMEAYHIYKSGWQWWLSKDDIKNLNANSSDFQVDVTEDQLIDKYLDRWKPGEVDFEHVAPAIIQGYLQRCSGINNLSIRKIGAYLQKAGFTRTQDKNKRWGYKVRFLK